MSQTNFNLYVCPEDMKETCELLLHFLNSNTPSLFLTQKDFKTQT